MLYLLTALAAYRAQRIVTDDEWPVSRRFRARLQQKAAQHQKVGPGGKPAGFWVATHKLFTCHYCFGTWVAIAVVILVHLFVADLVTGSVYHRVGVVALVAAATASVVGIIGDALE